MQTKPITIYQDLGHTVLAYEQERDGRTFYAYTMPESPDTEYVTVNVFSSGTVRIKNSIPRTVPTSLERHVFDEWATAMIVAKDIRTAVLSANYSITNRNKKKGAAMDEKELRALRHNMHETFNEWAETCDEHNGSDDPTTQIDEAYTHHVAAARAYYQALNNKEQTND